MCQARSKVLATERSCSMSSQCSIARSCIAIANCRLREGSLIKWPRRYITLQTLDGWLRAPQPALAKATFSIRKPINAEALSRESVLAKALGGEHKPKAIPQLFPCRRSW